MKIGVIRVHISPKSLKEIDSNNRVLFVAKRGLSKRRVENELRFIYGLNFVVRNSFNKGTEGYFYASPPKGVKSEDFLKREGIFE